MLKKILKEATRIEQWQQEIYTALHNINAEWITNGRLNISRLPTSSEANKFLVVRTANADPIYDVIVSGDIPNLDASKITSGVFDVARIPNLDASKITSGRFPLARLPTSATANRFLVVRTANADPVYDVIVAGDIPGLDASKIVSGTFDVARIPNLDASKITSGTFDVARIPNLDASKITSGRFPVSRLPDGTSGYVLVGQGTGYDIAWRDISGIAGTITDSQHGTKTGIPFAHHGDWGHYGKIPTSAPTGAAERAYVDSSNLYVHDGTSWVLRATKDWNNLINKPSTFPPSAHTHARADVTDFWSSPFWGNIPDKPSTFPPSTHASSHYKGGSDPLQGDLEVPLGKALYFGDSSYGPKVYGQSTNPNELIVQPRGGNYYGDIDILPSGSSPTSQIVFNNSSNYNNSGFITLGIYWDVYGYMLSGHTGSGSAPDNFRFGLHIYPYSDATYNLGASSLRWNNFYAVNKNAAFKHPLHNPERYIVFRCVESPKVTVEDWGIAELKDGKAFVGFSEEFVALMSDKTEYAVFLTPEGECNGLYVSKKEFYGFEVKELGNGKSNIRFSWQVKAIRIGDEETPVLEEPTTQFTDEERDRQLEWMKNRQEADKKKEEDRLNRMKQKIAKYREATSQA
jgi:hypothetical protein